MLMPLSTSRLVAGHRKRSVFIRISVSVGRPPPGEIGRLTGHMDTTRAASMSLAIRDAFPECTQLVDAFRRRIVRDQRPIDGADRDAGVPVGLKIGLGQRLIDLGLIRTERPTTLEEERDALERETPPRPRVTERLPAGGKSRRAWGRLGGSRVPAIVRTDDADRRRQC